MGVTDEWTVTNRAQCQSTDFFLIQNHADTVSLSQKFHQFILLLLHHYGDSRVHSQQYIV